MKNVVIKWDELTDTFWLKSMTGAFPDLDITEDMKNSPTGESIRRGDAPNPLIMEVTTD